MSDMREKLAKLVKMNAAVNGYGQIINEPLIADAIIAALPDMVKPLLWLPIKGGKGLSGKSGPSAYYVMPCFNDEWRIYGISGEYDGAEQVATLEAAKAAAQAHHTAAIMSAFGVQGGEV